MLLEITDGSVSRGGRTVLSHFDFAVRGTEKIAIVGRNGAGKTTLLQLLEGTLELDGNEKNPASGLRTARRLSVAMLRQNAFPDLSVKAGEILGCIGYTRHTGRPVAGDEAETQQSGQTAAAAGPEEYRRESDCDRLLTGFGFAKEDKNRPLSAFSGGQQEKLALIRLFLQEPDLLLLDEPTNHLDLQAVEFLEKWIRSYPKSVVMVSHDRWFLDRTAEVVYEVQNGRLTRWSGNYTRYREEKQAGILRQKKAWERQQEEIRHLQELIRRFHSRPNKAAFARSRKKLLERMVPLEKPEEDTAVIRTGELLPLRRSSKWVYQAEDLQIGYPGGFARTLDLRIRRGQKIGLVGPNGSGKTTLLRTLAGLQTPLAGRLSVGGHADLAYFDQNSAALEDERDILTWFRDRFPALTEQDARHTLAGYLFTGRDVRRTVSSLSGGEKARLTLAALLESRPNVLLLDEPTNHMDLPARETIESVLRAYQGTLLVISHDRYFVSRTAESLLLFEGEDIRYYPFGYESYMRWKEESEEAGAGTGTGELRAARLLKEQAVLESFHAVPGKSHLPGELSTEALARDWRLRECEKEMEAAFAGALAAAFEGEEQDRQAACRRWTDACLRWYEEWNM